MTSKINIFSYSEIKYTMIFKGYLENIIIWEQACFKYKYYFQKLEDILIQIRKKDKEMKEIHIVINEPDNNKNECDENINYDDENYQKLQIIIQAQELALLNDNFSRALASLECFANRCSEKEISNTFNYYDMFNLGKPQDLNELHKKALIQTQIFKWAYDDYINKYENYNIPENICLLEVINLVKKWMDNVPDDKRYMYQGMIDIISSSNNEEFDDKFKSYSEKCKNPKWA